MRLLDDSDVCIISGGLVGSNIACRLSQKKEGHSPQKKILDCRGLAGSLPKGLSFLDDKIRTIAAA
jgi:hypothetical protein